MSDKLETYEAGVAERFVGHIRLPIEVGPLLIRRTALEDHSDLVEMFSQSEVREYDPLNTLTADNIAWMLEQQATIRIGDQGLPMRFAIVMRRDWKVIGDCVLTITNVENRTAEFGISLNRNYWDRRLGALATHAMLGFGFGRLSLHRIFALTDPRNERCWRMMQRVGMRREAHHRRWRSVKGEWIDDYLYAMLADEWEPSTGDGIATEVPPE
ncbi:MAG: GNAT family N-acetyltransferase [Pirellulaceae bacterium]|jgi:RimJ/RimL family protein N-acetyltransferase|nr:GNAT family N-acetyltransferase [Pirellulaceae bacterium]